MKIKEVQIDGFGVWSGLTVDTMPDGMTVFYGPNEAGKTTLMQFLRTMFYGFTTERRNRYLPPVYGGKAGGALRVTGPGGGYEISRRAQLNDASVVGQLTVTGSDGIVQGAHRMAILLGQVDESIFTNVFAIGLRELQELSTLDDTAAADELYKLSSGLDRVSLVDVIRQLKSARTQIAGPTPDVGQIQSMMLRREKLRDEQEQLAARGRRWGELASQRRSHQNEIDELKERGEQWELEAKTLETAIQVRQPWQDRDKHRVTLRELNARVDLPEDAGDRLRQLQSQMDDRKSRLHSIREQRKGVRTRANQLPVRKNILELASKIEAAAEQAPWIGALQKQIQRLESQVQQTTEQLIEDASRLGLNEADQKALLDDKRLTNLPDLSRQAISQLAGPAREVRVQAVRLKQSKSHAENDSKEVARLKSQIDEFLATRDQTDLQQAMQRQQDLISTLRKHQSVYERLDKLVKHRKDIEGEAIHLGSDEALPVDRILLLAIPFIFGGYMLIAGLGKFLNLWFVTNRETDATVGMMMMLIGIIAIFAWFTWRKLTERGTSTDLDDVESQLDGLVRQIKKTEQERDEIERALPNHSGSIEQRLKEAEHELGMLEGQLPVYQNYEAAVQRYQAAKKRGSSASHQLKAAKEQWAKTLQHLGLAESLSPKSIRIMAEGYESLTQSRRRLKTQEDELAQRKLELASINQRIDGLARQSAIAFRQDGSDLTKRASLTANKSSGTESERREQRRMNERNRDTHPLVNDDRILLSKAQPSETEPAEGTVVQLQELTGILAEQQQYIQQRRSLREEDVDLAKQQKAIQASIDKLVRARQTLLADLGVENQEQLEEHLALKVEHYRLVKLIEELDSRIRAIIGGHVPYESISRLLESPNTNDLEKRWEALQERVQQSEQRVLQLHQRQGETGQEMKTLGADRRLAEVKLELACVEKQIKACAEHWQVLAATTCMLEKVCEVYETERQPETLRESSAFLKQLTDGKYVRVWTPLGKNALRVDNENGQSLPLEVLSRGTRETVFIALRLSLAAAYARRGVTLPIVLDDVLVNFDTHRAKSAARVLRDFADLGHQVVMFTCHEHIMQMFHDIDVQVRVLPAQGHPGDAKIYHPETIESIPEAKPPVSVEPYVERYIEEYVAKPQEEDESLEEFSELPVLEIKAPTPVPFPVEILAEVPKPTYVAALEPTPAPLPIRSPKVQTPQPPIVVKPTVPPIEHLWYERDPAEALWHELEDFPRPADIDNHVEAPDSWWHASPIP